VLIPGPARDVVPTVQAVASEVGRIERKLESVMKNESGPGDTTDLAQLLNDLWEKLNSLQSGGEYLLTSECRRDSDGDPLPPIAVPYEGGLSPLAAISAKIDALAQLLQVHKDLPTHVCRRPPPTGQRVWVTFDVDP
jgi:hypothetical protein